MRNKKQISSVISLLLVVSLILCSMPATIFAASSTPITFKFDNFADVSGLKLNGNALQMSESGDSAIRLTDSVGWQNASVYSGNYISLANERSFSTMFSFKITNPQPGTSGADGVVFVINNNTNNLGAAGGGIGYSGMVNSLGVEFDTWDNGTSFGDSSLSQNHVAININGDTTRPIAKITESDIEKLYGVSAGTFNFGNGTSNGNVAPAVGSEKTYFAWVDYDGKNKLLSVRMNANSNVRPAKAIINQNIDLGTSTTLTNDKVYVGFTGATGGSFSKEYIKSWYFNNDYITSSIDTLNNTYVEAPKITLKSTPSSDTTTALITATVKNSDGTILSGVPVTFSVLSGPNATFTTPTTVTTDANGIATATIDGSNVPNGKIVVNGAIDVSKGGNNSTVSIDNFGKSEILATISDSTINISKNSTYQFIGKEFSSNYTSNVSSVKITAIPPATEGVLKNNSVAVVVGDIIPASKFNLLTFVTASSFAGKSTIQWQATSDDITYSNSANLSFNIKTNSTPTASNASATTSMNTPVSGKITASDADNDALNYMLTTQALKGDVSVNSTNGQWTYTPKDNATGLDSFNVTIVDKYGASVTANVLITIGDVSPSPSVNPLTGALYESSFGDKTGVVNLRGDWGINKGLAPTSGLENRVIFENTNEKDYEITVDATLNSGSGGYGILYHVTNPQNLTGYVFQYDIGAGKNFLVKKFSNGSEVSSALKSVTMQSVMGDSFNVNAPHKIVIRVEGSQQIFKVDGVEVFRLTDSTYASGYVGLRSWSTTDVKFNYVKVATLNPTSTPTPTPTVTPTATPTPTPVTTEAPIVVLAPTPTVVNDIPTGSTVRVSFSYAYLYGYGNNIGDVGADDTIKREEASALVYRILKQNDKLGSFARPSSSTFNDVATERWSFSALEYMTFLGVYDKNKGTLSPDAPISRGEAAKIITFSLRIKPDSSTPDSVVGFTDLPTNNSYYFYIKALVDAGVLQGYTDGTIKPDGQITRAEFVTMVNRLIGRDYNVADMKNLYPDLDKSHWAYDDLLLASYGFTADTSGKYLVDPTKKPPREQIDYK